MKYLIITMALFSAFFVSGEVDQDNLVAPQNKPMFTFNCSPSSSTPELVTGDVESGTLCQGIWSASINEVIQAHLASGFYKSAGSITWTDVNKYSYDYTLCRYGDCETFGTGDSKTSSGSRNYLLDSREDVYSCPPTGFPEHVFSVPVEPSSPDAPPFMCGRETDLEEPVDTDDDDCSEFGQDTFLPTNGTSAPTGGNVCYTNPVTGHQCQFSQNPLQNGGFSATGQACSGEEPDYGDLPPENGTDGECASVGTAGDFYALCPIDPAEECNPLQINGDTVYQCPQGCGEVNGQYVCSEPDSDGDGTPDSQETTDPDDPDEPDDTDEPQCEGESCGDLTQTNQLLEGIQTGVNGLGTKLDGIKTGINGVSTRLDGINTGIQGIKSQQTASNTLLGSISNSNSQIATNTAFTADNTGKLLESFDEFKEGIGETDIDSNFNPSDSASFYESEYEEGFEGVWNEKSLEFKQTETFNFLQQFAFNSGGTPPDTQMCFNLGSHMDFGCAELPTPSPQLLAILKVFILITAAFLCRALIFGG